MSVVDNRMDKLSSISGANAANACAFDISIRCYIEISSTDSESLNGRQTGNSYEQ